MPRYVIERSFAEQLEFGPEEAEAVRLVNADAGVQWLLTFLSADRKKTYCLYEAPNADAIRAAALRANLPVDAIVEVSELRPDAFA